MFTRKDVECADNQIRWNDKVIKLIRATLLFIIAGFSLTISANDDVLSDEELAVSISLESLLASSNRSNLISLLQAGTSNEAILLQLGSNNSIELEQIGNNNFTYINQQGDGNKVDLRQFGNHNFDVIKQVGNDNLVQIDALGGTGFIIHQISDNAVLRITQF